MQPTHLVANAFDGSCWCLIPWKGSFMSSLWQGWGCKPEIKQSEKKDLWREISSKWAYVAKYMLSCQDVLLQLCGLLWYFAK